MARVSEPMPRGPRTEAVSALASGVLAAGLLVAGCGGGEGGSRSVRPAPGGSGTRAPHVDMRATRYVPANVVVRRGGEITWRNSDPFAHTVTKVSGPGPRFDSGPLARGATYRLRFSRPGVIRYVCTIHPNQRGTITVR